MSMSDDVLSIIENGEQRDIDAASATSLETDGIIYWCDSCGQNYPIDADLPWADVDKALKNV